MAGLGRRSHYRKHLTDSVLYELPEPDAKQGDCIAKVVGTRGGNLFEVFLSEHQPSEKEREAQLAILPTKFHKLVWVKRNDFVICRTGQENDGKGGIRYLITHILYRDQIRHLKDKNIWPTDDDEFNSVEDRDQEPPSHCKELPGEESNDGESHLGEKDRQQQKIDDGIVYEDDHVDEDYFLNTNRIKNMKLEDDSSSASESNEE